MRKIPKLTLVGAFLFALCTQFLKADDFKVPFNFQWGETPQRLEDVLKGVQATVVERRTVNGRLVFTVEGIPQRLLQRAMFYFQSDSLNEIELIYGDDSWDSEQYKNFFDRTRRNIDEKYGVGRVIARQKTREADVLQTLVGYQWVRGSTSLQLYLYTAERNAETVRVLSLHYRGY